jgi:predicted oxidoreductase
VIGPFVRRVRAAAARGLVDLRFRHRVDALTTTGGAVDGLHTDLDARVLGPDGAPVPGLYAVGEAAGFGGGGMHGYRSLEGTFLGGCLFSGRTAGRALAHAL